jgi:nitroreductase
MPGADPRRFHFPFLTAFDRNIGWLTEWEQQALKGKRVAIAGMGGVGGFHLLTLARLGVGQFHIADLDRFEIENFNRQVGATLPTIGRPKVEVLAEMARAINPNMHLKLFPEGVREGELDAFLEGVDLFIDGYDFFVLDIRRKTFARCEALGIPALTAAPIGMGVGFVAFGPGSMRFEDYFRFEGQPELRQYIHFLLGVGPKGIHRAYLADPSRLDFARKKAPSTIIGVQLAASVTAAAAVHLLLNRPGLKLAPHHHHYDAYLGKLVTTTLPRGNAGRWQQFKARMAEKAFRGLAAMPPQPAAPRPANALEEIIDHARWTPSGDNAQPWRFQLLDDDSMRVRIRDASAGNVYEYRGGEPTLLSAGMLLCSLRIAAAAEGRRLEWRYGGRDDQGWTILARFPADPAIPPDPLYAAVALRSVDRTRYGRRTLSAAQKERLTAALGEGLELHWYETAGQRLAMARLNAMATGIRLRIPETFEIHRALIDWTRPRSPTGIPACALGLDKPTLKIMRWAMQSWPRMDRLNRTTGTFSASLQMDYLPGLFCAAHFSVRRKSAGAAREEDLLETGMALQRFWLTATDLGLAVQPGLAPLAFAHWGRSSAAFTSDAKMRHAATALARKADQVLAGGGEGTLFAGRIGVPRPHNHFCRSTRLSFDQLIESRPG